MMIMIAAVGDAYGDPSGSLDSDDRWNFRILIDGTAVTPEWSVEAAGSIQRGFKYLVAGKRTV